MIDEKGPVRIIAGFVPVSQDGDRIYFLDTNRNRYVGFRNEMKDASDPMRAFYCMACEAEIPKKEIDWKKDSKGMSIPFHLIEELRTFWDGPQGKDVERLTTVRHVVRVTWGVRVCSAPACPMCGSLGKDELEGYCSNQHRLAMRKRLFTAGGVDSSGLILCEICGKTCFTRGGLKRHKTRKHGRPSIVKDGTPSEEKFDSQNGVFREKPGEESR